MKKIVIMTPSLGMGGMERVLINYANLFVAYGYDVTVLNLTYHDNTLLKGLNEKVHYKSYYTPIKHISKCSLKEIVRGKFRLTSALSWIKKHKARFLYKQYIKEKYDIEIAFFGGITAKILSGSTNKDVKRFAWIHSANIKGLMQDIGGESQFSSVYNAFDKVVCVSTEIMQGLKGIVDETRLCVLHNPHNVQKVRTLAQETVVLEHKGLNFINVSRLDDKSKGFVRLLDVCKRLNEEGLVYHLWIVGDGIDAERIRQHAHDLSLQNVHFLGQQENPYKYMAAADFYVCSSYYEGFSMTMMEAIILAKPIITTKVSGASEMLDDGQYGMIVENSEEGLFEGLRQILKDEKLRLNYFLKAQERKDCFNEKELMARFEKMTQEGLECLN